ncbi:chromatin remodeling regulator CECR2-like [Macrobrachium nipponense]|uniref:chromatin remodeling regulator CECR2-like n=1 Tax=Macrobrachium nipponense TaxID=159736 RepID=UPI0030C7DFDB
MTFRIPARVNGKELSLKLFILLTGVQWAENKYHASVAFSLNSAAVVSEPAVNTVNSVTSPPTKKKVKSAHMVLQTEDDLRTGMYKVLEHLRDHEDAWPFHDPVEEEYAPNYYAVIRRPMHITRMEERLDGGYYTNLAMFEGDFKLMMDNCKLYNGPESGEYMAKAILTDKVNVG